MRHGVTTPLAFCRTNIIIIWHYTPLWGFAFSARSLQVILPLAVSFQFFDVTTSLVSLEHGVYGWEKVTSHREVSSKCAA
jgi:hypothetical protein